MLVPRPTKKLNNDSDANYQKERTQSSSNTPDQDKIVVFYTMANKNEKIVINNIKDRIVLVDHIRKLCACPKGMFITRNLINN